MRSPGFIASAATRSSSLPVPTRTATATSRPRSFRASRRERSSIDNSGEFERLCKVYEISHDRFIRTAVDEDHKKGVQEFVRRWIASGDIYKGTYEGLYCRGCEAFYEESELIDGRCPLHPTRPEYLQRIKEENYFFRLSKYEKALRELFEKDPDFTVPE